MHRVASSELEATRLPLKPLSVRMLPTKRYLHVDARQGQAREGRRQAARHVQPHPPSMRRVRVRAQPLPLAPPEAAVLRMEAPTVPAAVARRVSQVGEAEVGEGGPGGQAGVVAALVQEDLACRAAFITARFDV